MRGLEEDDPPRLGPWDDRAWSDSSRDRREGEITPTRLTDDSVAQVRRVPGVQGSWVWRRTLEPRVTQPLDYFPRLGGGAPWDGAALYDG